MESKGCLNSAKQGSPEELPSLFQDITSKAVPGFDTTPSPRAESSLGNVPEEQELPLSNSPIQATGHNRTHSISVPCSPSIFHVEQASEIVLTDTSGMNATDGQGNHLASPTVVVSRKVKEAKFYSQPISAGNAKRTPEGQRLKDRRFDSFKTWSGRLERQISNLRGKPHEPKKVTGAVNTEAEAVPAVARYFDALQGPELDTLRPSEELVLPGDKKWPFLLRYPVSSFGMCLGVSSQAILWKTIATAPSTSFLHVSLDVNLVLWYISLALMGCISLIYFLKIVFYFEAVRREYYHPIRVNFFFAPWIACLFLVIGVPPSVAVNLHAAVWYVLMTPILCLELKIYGQWMSGGQRRLSKVANPSNHLSIVGNFVGALLGASMDLREGPIFFFAVGVAHYIVLFVTLYQRLPTNETLPKELHPVFFLFVAAPSVACMAWAKISGDFNFGSRIAYFIALFLYFSLAVRINFFRGFRFSLAWWAYTFPMTGAAIATIRYSTEVKNVFTQSLAVALSGISTVTVSALLVSTMVHAFVLHDLFPNDISIAITDRRTKSTKKHTHTLLTAASSNTNDIEACIPTDILPR